LKGVRVGAKTVDDLYFQCSDPCSISAEQLEAAMRYTLQARLSPSWNIMGRYFVRGLMLALPH